MLTRHPLGFGMYPDNLRAVLEEREAREAETRRDKRCKSAAQVADERAADQTPEPPTRLA